MIKALILGLVQGFTEFLPVSSSGHLALLEKLFNIPEPVAVAAFLHFGTLFATVIFFWKPIVEIVRGLFRGEKVALRYVFYIVLGSIPAGVFALCFRKMIEESFTDIRLIGLFLGLTGLVLVLTAIFKKGKEKMNLARAIAMGFAQMLAVFPGISRSGATIATGLITRTEPDSAFRFSFLLSLPAIFAANLLELKGLSSFGNWGQLLAGFGISCVAGLAALYLLRRLVREHFHYFGIYCLLISLLIVLFLR
jgi:undecaprenyl-diphosphatase